MHWPASISHQKSVSKKISTYGIKDKDETASKVKFPTIAILPNKVAVDRPTQIKMHVIHKKFAKSWIAYPETFSELRECKRNPAKTHLSDSDKNYLQLSEQISTVQSFSNSWRKKHNSTVKPSFCPKSIQNSQMDIPTNNPSHDHESSIMAQVPIEVPENDSLNLRCNSIISMERSNSAVLSGNVLTAQQISELAVLSGDFDGPLDPYVLFLSMDKNASRLRKTAIKQKCMEIDGGSMDYLVFGDKKVRNHQVMQDLRNKYKDIVKTEISTKVRVLEELKHNLYIGMSSLAAYKGQFDTLAKEDYEIRMFCKQLKIEMNDAVSKTIGDNEKFDTEIMRLDKDKKEQRSRLISQFAHILRLNDISEKGLFKINIEIDAIYSEKEHYLKKIVDDLDELKRFQDSDNHDPDASAKDIIAQRKLYENLLCNLKVEAEKMVARSVCQNHKLKKEAVESIHQMVFKVGRTLPQKQKDKTVSSVKENIRLKGEIEYQGNYCKLMEEYLLIMEKELIAKKKMLSISKTIFLPCLPDQ